MKTDLLDIRNCDCMDLMREYPDKHFDLCVTDPPYGVGFNYNTYDDSEENWYALMQDFIPEVRRVCKMVVMCSCQIKRLPWFYRNHVPDWLIIWHKGSTGHVGQVGFNDYEPLIVWGKSHSRLQMHDHFYCPPESMKRFVWGHPCPKPVDWYKWIMHRAANNGRVIDPFMGSGSAAIAAHDLGLHLTACELDEDYFNAACERIKRETAQLEMALV